MKVALLAAFAAIAGAAWAQQPAVQNGKVETRPFSGALASQLSQLGPGPFWAGYSEPVDGKRSWDDCRGTLHLEGETAVVFLIRVEAGAVGEVRTASPDCRIDAGSLPFYWIDGVPPAAGIAWLKTQMSGRHQDWALSAIAMLADPAATRTLIDLARNDKDPKIRGKALTGLARKAADKQAAEVIDNAAINDPDRAVKERAVLALNQLPPAQGIPLLIDLAKRNADPNVRKKAVFWLGQSKDPRALEFIAQVLATR